APFRTPIMGAQYCQRFRQRDWVKISRAEVRPLNPVWHPDPGLPLPPASHDTDVRKRLKVFSTCTEWITQFRSYRRNKDGDLVEESEGLLRGMDLVALSGTMIGAPSEGKTDDARDEDWRAGRDPLTGY